MDNLISVIVPVYNVEKYLEYCLESIINQTYRNLEIILVDDGSTDRSSQICDEYAEKDNRIIVIHKENGGQSTARNLGISIATGKYISYVDSDDFIDTDMYTQLIKLATESNADMVVFNGVRCKSEKEIDDYYDDTDKITEFSCKEAILNFINATFERKKIFQARVWSSLYKTDCIKTLRFPEGIIYEDGYYYPEALLKCEKLIHVDKTFYFYRYNPSSTMSSGTTQKSLKSIDDWEFIHEKVKEKFPEYAHFAAKRWVVRLLNMYDYLIKTDEIDQSGECKQHIVEKIRTNYDYFLSVTDDSKIKKKIRVLNKSTEKYSNTDFNHVSFFKKCIIHLKVMLK